MRESIVDILFLGLILIPLVIHLFNGAAAYLVNSYNKVRKRNKHYLLSLPLALYIIYDTANKTNWAATIALCVGFLLFFYIYACGIAALVNNAAIIYENDD